MKNTTSYKLYPPKFPHLYSEVGVLGGDGVADEFLLNEGHQGDLSVPGIETADGRLTHLRLGEGGGNIDDFKFLTFSTENKNKKCLSRS